MKNEKARGSSYAVPLLIFRLMFVSLTLEIHNSKLQIEVFSVKTI